MGRRVDQRGRGQRREYLLLEPMVKTPRPGSLSHGGESSSARLAPGGHSPIHRAHKNLSVNGGSLSQPRQLFDHVVHWGLTPGGQGPVHGGTGRDCQEVLMSGGQSPVHDIHLFRPGGQSPDHGPIYFTLATVSRSIYHFRGSDRAPFKGTQGPTGSATCDHLYPSHRLLQG